MGEPVKIVARNNKAHHDYFIEEKYETGIELAGTEVKSIRLGNVNLKDSFCLVKDGEISVLGMHISPYEKGNIFNKDPRRTRRLLMHKREILRLFGRIKQDGYSLIPLSVYFKGPRVKLEISTQITALSLYGTVISAVHPDHLKSSFHKFMPHFY